MTMKKINGMRVDAIFFILSILLFFLWPQLDLIVAGAFFDVESQRFSGMDMGWVKFIHAVFAEIQIPMLLLLIAGIILYSKKKQGAKKMRCVYLLCCLLVGPGLIVNVWLKDNSIGRARPKHVQEFGGDHQFTPPFVYSGACEKNCSFTSGHASVGFVFLAMFWALRQRYYFYFGLALGAMLGWVRIVMGGHFLSDVLFSFWFVYFSSLWLNRYFYPKMHPSAENENLAQEKEGKEGEGETQDPEITESGDSSNGG
ncbi:MAG: phosphatase PAP2 family protein [Agarilytica sp.]